MKTNNSINLSGDYQASLLTFLEQAISLSQAEGAEEAEAEKPMVR